MSAFKELLEKADFYKQRISSARPLEGAELKSLDNYFRIGFTYSSNALEGNTLTLSETKILLEDGLTVGVRPLKDCYEAVGHSKAYDFMLTLARQKDMDITEESIMQLHLFFIKRWMMKTHVSIVQFRSISPAQNIYRLHQRMFPA